MRIPPPPAPPAAPVEPGLAQIDALAALAALEQRCMSERAAVTQVRAEIDAYWDWIIQSDRLEKET